MTSTRRDRVFLRDLRVEAHIGYFPGEKGVRQPLVVTIEIEVAGADFTRDELSQTVDYTTLAGFVETLAAGHIDLIETFAERLAERCLALPRAGAVLIRVEKPCAVPGGMAGVEITRTALPRD
jgi:dihydroneopterin aldolase